MGMVAMIKRIPPELAPRLQTFTDEELDEILFPGGEEDEATTDDLDKAWDAICHLLSAATEGRIAHIFTRGTSFGGDLGYGPGFVLTHDEVRSMANDLMKISTEELLRQYDPAELEKAEVYGTWDNSRDSTEYIEVHYKILRTAFETASNEGSAVVLWLC